MIKNKRSFWLSLGLLNLCIVAFFGFSLRSKILFPLPFLDYSRLLSAHSHFAFAGWAGLCLSSMFVYDILPPSLSQKRIYQWILAGIEISGLGMAFLFPLLGYQYITIAFSTLYVIAVLVFIPVLIRDIIKAGANKNVRLLVVSALLSLLLSFLGTIGLMYIIMSKTVGSLLYRDSIYTFLHFQYNGFFTLSVFALLMNYVSKKGIELNKNAQRFSTFLCLSVVPALFLSLLWHNKTLFYMLAAIGCFFIILAVLFFIRLRAYFSSDFLFSSGISKTFCTLSLMSFLLKMILQVATIFPQLGNAVYGDRPVIIGFLHLVFLGFISFFILAVMIENGYFTMDRRIMKFPFIAFSTGLLLNEFILMLQGLGILFQTNNDIYKWLLWVAAIILFAGALLIALGRLNVTRSVKKIKPPSRDGLMR